MYLVNGRDARGAGARGTWEKLLTASEAMGLARGQAQAIAGPRGMSRYFLPVKNSLMFSPLNLAPSTTVWPTPVNISLNPGPT